MSEEVTGSEGGKEQEKPEPQTEEQAGTFTQEDMNKAVGQAKLRERAKYADYDKYKKAYTDIESLTSERDALLHSENVRNWKNTIALETGVPAEVLEGGTEEEISAHAARLKPYFEKTSSPVITSDGKRPQKTDLTNSELFATTIDEFL